MYDYYRSSATNAILTGSDLERLDNWFGEDFVSILLSEGHVYHIGKPDIKELAKYNRPAATVQLHREHPELTIKQCHNMIRDIANQ